MEKLKDFPDLLTVKELKKILRVGHVKAYSITNEKDFPCINLGKKKLIPKDEFEIWIKNKENNNKKLKGE